MSLTKKTKDLVEKYVLGRLGYTSITEDNVDEIVDYVADNLDVLLLEAKEAGDDIDEGLLSLVSNSET